MKAYLSPETKSLQVNAQTMICASGEAPAPARTIKSTSINPKTMWV